MTIEDHLRSALKHHAEQVEPSPDGLDRIQARLEPSGRQRPPLAPRLLAAAAVLIVVGLAGVLSFRSTGTGDVEVAVSSSTTNTTALAAVENELPPRDDPDGAESTRPNGSGVVEVTPTFADIPPAPAGVLGPRAASPEAAVELFLGLIQRGTEDVMIELQNELASVTRISEGGLVVDVTTVELGSVELADGSTGFVVVEARSPRIVIETPTRLSANSDARLSLTGQGEGFEGTIHVDLYSSDDGVWLSSGFTQAGNFGVLAPFETDLAVSGSGPAWLVVKSSGGTETMLEPFAAVPITLDAPLSEPTYTITNIPTDDPDGGLVVRSLPGTDGTQVGVLPPGQSGINKRAVLSAFIGDGEPSYGLGPVGDGQQEWWSVWLPEPMENGRNWGWVNARYLAVDGPVANGDLEAIGSQFVEGLRGDDAAFASMNWADDVTFGLSNDLSTTIGGKAALPEFWQDSFSFTLPPDFGGTLDGSLREILSPTGSVLAPETAVGIAVVPLDSPSPYSVVNADLAARFPGASVVQVTDPTNDGSGWRLINLFVQQTNGSPEVVGVVNILWTP